MFDEIPRSIFQKIRYTISIFSVLRVHLHVSFTIALDLFFLHISIFLIKWSWSINDNFNFFLAATICVRTVSRLGKKRLFAISGRFSLSNNSLRTYIFNSHLISLLLFTSPAYSFIFDESRESIIWEIPASFPIEWFLCDKTLSIEMWNFRSIVPMSTLFLTESLIFVEDILLFQAVSSLILWSIKYTISLITTFEGQSNFLVFWTLTYFLRHWCSFLSLLLSVAISF